MGGIAFIYFVTSAIAAFGFRPKLRVAMLMPVLGSTIGAIIGFCEGALYGK